MNRLTYNKSGWFYHPFLIYRKLYPADNLLPIYQEIYLISIMAAGQFVHLNFCRRCIEINSELRVNDRIRAKEVRLISADGSQVGIISTADAMRLSEEKGLDLVEVAPQANPPVCKIMDYGKYKYEQAKKSRKAKKNQNVMNVKEVQMGLKIETHDFNVKLRMARRFLENKDKVKVRVKFRGRELMHKELGYGLMKRIIDGIEDLGRVESKPKMEGRNMFMILTPHIDN